MVWKVRNDNLVSQHIEVALVYREMLGQEEAVSYLEREGIPGEIAERLLLTEQQSAPRIAPAAELPAQAPFTGCRRKNRVHDAIVEAALKIEQKLGREIALALLRQEQVPDQVIARVTASGPRQLRARRPGA